MKFDGKGLALILVCGLSVSLLPMIAQADRVLGSEERLMAQSTPRKGKAALKKQPPPQAKADWKTSPAVSESAAAAEAAAATATGPETGTTNIPDASAVLTDLPAATPADGPQATGSSAQDTPPLPPASPAMLLDESEEVLQFDRAFAEALAKEGPKAGYGRMISAEGTLYDASGGAPPGPAAADAKFSNFPKDITFVRTPEKAMAAGGSGSSWGTYAIQRGETALSRGHYVTVWRREPEGWRIVSELAAGRNVAPSSTPGQPNSTGASNGALPRPAPVPRPLGRAGEAPIMRDALGRPISSAPAPKVEPASSPTPAS